MIDQNQIQLLEHQIIQCLEEIVHDFHTPTEKRKSVSWITKQIKDKIGTIGESHGFEVRSTERNGEWLYDIVWNKREKNQLKEVILALESELSSRDKVDLKSDFEKILQSSASLKVMICFGEGNSKDNNVDNVKSFLEEIHKAWKSSNPSSRVLLLIWEDYNFGKIHDFILD